jgi:hypothetical protein
LLTPRRDRADKGLDGLAGSGHESVDGDQQGENQKFLNSPYLALKQLTRSSTATNLLLCSLQDYTKLILARIKGVINGFCTDTADNKFLRAEENRLRHVLITEEGFNKMKDVVIKILEESNELRHREEAWKEILSMDLFVVRDKRDKARVELDEERLTVAMLKEDITNLEKELLRVQRQLNEHQRNIHDSPHH